MNWSEPCWGALVELETPSTIGSSPYRGPVRNQDVATEKLRSIRHQRHIDGHMPHCEVGQRQDRLEVLIRAVDDLVACPHSPRTSDLDEAGRRDAVDVLSISILGEDVSGVLNEPGTHRYAKVA